MARPGQRQAGARRTAPRKQRRAHYRGDVVSVLSRTVREVEAAARRGRVTPAERTKFQAVALLLRDERARVRAAAGSDSHRAEQLKRLDGIATILARTAVQDAGLLALLAEDSGVSDAARSLKRPVGFISCSSRASSVTRGEYAAGRRARNAKPRPRPQRGLRIRVHVANRSCARSIGESPASQPSACPIARAAGVSRQQLDADQAWWSAATGALAKAERRLAGRSAAL